MIVNHLVLSEKFEKIDRVQRLRESHIDKHTSENPAAGKSHELADRQAGKGFVLIIHSGRSALVAGCRLLDVGRWLFKALISDL